MANALTGPKLKRKAGGYKWDGKAPSLGRLKWNGADGWLSDGGSRGAGRLLLKVSCIKVEGEKTPQTKITFYFSYFNSEKRRRFYQIGDFQSMSLKNARIAAGELSRLYLAGTLDIHQYFAAVRQAEAKARQDTQDAAQKAEARAKAHTLRELLEAYGGFLRRAGKQSAGDVESIFRLHVLDARPDLARSRAADISVDEFVPILGKLIEAKKGRTAGKLRSYLRAAYALAMRSKTDPDAPLILRAFDIHANPIASIDAKALSKYNRARTRNLSADELRHFLIRIDETPPTVKKDALNLCLLLGGQRPIQLLRVRPEDADLSAQTLTIYDAKGSRREPRAHVLPLTRKTAAIVQRLLERCEESPSIFTNDGKRPMRSETVSSVVTELSKAMVKAREARQAFELRDVRRTCETMLAALGVSKDIRAQLQSHGLSGVQQRHYDKHEYMLEKRAALVKWEAQLLKIISGKSAMVYKSEKAFTKARTA